MKVIIFGATGMVGRGVLRECLRDPEVEKILLIGRTEVGVKHDKLRELVRQNLFDFSSVEPQLVGWDACFFCLGITSVGMTEEAYTRITRDIALAAGQTLAKLNPGMTFVFVSGAGSDSSEKSKTMWARVKGKAENAVLALPFKAAYVFRPAVIEPMHGVVSKTKSYRIGYAIMRPVFPLLRLLFPKLVTTTERVGLAMLEVVRHGAPQRVLENQDINAAWARGASPTAKA
jgi:uncharacterized protein YbjT (DUF2867 family)